MRHIFILLLILAAFPGQAEDTPADAGSTSQTADSAPKKENGDTSQAADSASSSDEGHKPAKAGEEEEEPDCD